MSNTLVHYDHTKACEEKFLLPYWVQKCCPPGGKGGWWDKLGGWDWHIYVLLLLSCFSRVWLCVTPEIAAYQALLSLGFTRQEHWSGLPFPSPMHESEKWKWSRSVVSSSSRSHGLQPTRLLRPWDLPGKSTGVGCHCLLWYMRMYVCIYIDIYMCIYIHTYIHIYIYVYIHYWYYV